MYTVLPMDSLHQPVHQCTVEPPNKGHFGSRGFVLFSEVVLWWEVRANRSFIDLIYLGNMFLKLLSAYLHHVLQFPDKITNDELQKHVSFHSNTTRDVLGSGGGVARGVRTVECIVLQVKLINVNFVWLTCRKE